MGKRILRKFKLFELSNRRKEGVEKREIKDSIKEQNEINTGRIKSNRKEQEKGENKQKTKGEKNKGKKRGKTTRKEKGGHLQISKNQ